MDKRGLTDEQRRWLGTAIAMAAADGVLAAEEQALIERIARYLGLGAEARDDIEEIIKPPPSPVQVASWAIEAKDRLELYRAAAMMASADGEVDAAESRLLDSLAAVLRLTDEELARLRS